MIRLGSLAGYSFEGPRVLGGWTPPAAAAVYVILYKPRPEERPEDYAVIYAGHADDLSAVGFPFQHARSSAWMKHAGDKWNLHIATLAAPGALRGHREQIVKELVATYHPACNEEQFDNDWDDTWIQDYDTPLQDPLTTNRSLRDQ